jgi:hypothetical protein
MGMDREVRGELAVLEGIAPELNAASDAATAVVRRVEERLAAMDLGISAETEVFERRVEGSAGDSSMLTYRLAYGRLGRCHQIHIREDLVYRDEPGDDYLAWLRSEQLPWSSCPRNLRLRAFRELPALPRALVSRARALVEGVTSTGSQAEALLDGLSGDTRTSDGDERGSGPAA